MIHPALEPRVHAARENPAPHPSTIEYPERRAAYHEQALADAGPLEDMAEVSDHVLPLEGRDLAARLYVPHAEEGKAIIVYFHGGSFVVGDLDTHDALCRRLAVDTGMRLLAVDYRLAPEHPFPAGVDDAADALRFVVAHRSRYGPADARVIAMGDSAGATLVAVAAASTRHEGLGLAAQVLIYPTLGPEMLTDSAHDYGHGYLLEIDHLRYDYGRYLGEVTDHTDPRISPLLYGDLTGAPPAIVVVAECDPLRDEGLAYAGLLEHFAVPVESLEAKGMVHGFVRLGGVIPEAREIVDDLAEHLHRFADQPA